MEICRETVVTETIDNDAEEVDGESVVSETIDNGESQ